MRDIILAAAIIFIAAMAWADPEIRLKITTFYESVVSEDDNVQTTSIGENPTVTLTANRSGHFSARAMINGSEIDFLVDTGATIIFIGREDARRVGIDLKKLVYNNTAQTASGKIKFARVKLKEVRVGNIIVRNVEAAIAQTDQVAVNLLGMTFLSRIKSFEFKGNRLVLRD